MGLKKGCISWKKGKNNSKEHNKNISIGKIGKKQSKEHILNRKLSRKITVDGMTKEERKNKFGRNTEANRELCRQNGLSVRNDPVRLEKQTKHMFYNNPMNCKESVEKIRKKAQDRFADDVWRSKQMIVVRDNGFGYSHESQKHIDLKQKVIDQLKTKGFSIEVEKLVKIKHCWYIVDVVGIGLNKNIAIECGKCSKKKLDDLKNEFDEVVHIDYNMEVLI